MTSPASWAIWDTFRRSDFTRHVAVVLSGALVAQVITLLVSPVLTRLYSPADFGILSVYVSLLSLGTVAASLRYEVAIPLPVDDSDAANLLALSLALVVVLSAVVGVTTLLLGPRILHDTNYETLLPFTWLLPLGIVGAGTYQALSYWAIRRSAFPVVARTKIMQSVGQALTQTVCGVFRLGPVGLLVGDVVGRVGGTGTLSGLVYRMDRKAFNDISTHNVWRVAKRYRRFPLFSSGSSILNAATLQAPLLLLAAFYGPDVAGLFALGQRVLAAPMSVIGSAVASVYYGKLAAAAKTEPARLKPMFLQLTRRLLVLGLPPVLLVASAGPWICEVAFGREWRAAGEYLRLIAPMLLIQFVASPLGGTLDVLERQDLHLIREIVRQVLSLGALVTAYQLSLTAPQAIIAFGLAGTVGNGFYIASTWYALNNAIELSSRPLSGSAS